MKALVITEHGPPDVLRVQERPDPEPGPGELRIRVRAAGVNFADLLGRVGLYPDAPKPPCVVGYEVAGDVDALGEGVEATPRAASTTSPCVRDVRPRRTSRGHSREPRSARRRPSFR